MMKLFKITLVTLAVCLVSVPLLSCAAKSESTSTQSQTATVQRGDLLIDIPATGNLALSHTEDLAFDMAGVVEEVLVGEGDSVKEGQVLATLDTSDRDKQLKTLEKALVTAKSDQSDAESKVTDRELAVVSAQLDLQTAEDSLKQIAKVKEAQDLVDDAEYNLKVARGIVAATGIPMGTESPWNEQTLQDELARYKQNLQDIKSGTSVTVSSDVALQVAKAQLQVEQKQRSLETAQIALDDWKQGITDYQQAVADAQEALDEIKNTHPEVKATFDGFITNVNVEGGDEIKKGTVAVTLADPNKFETEVLVSEMDIFDVKLGGSATVEVDANPDISLSANVTHIAPTATVSQGVVNYKVKVQVQSPQLSQSGQSQISSSVSGNQTPFTPGQRPSSVSGNQTPFNQRFSSPSGLQALPTQASQIAQLKQGLTVTVSIMVDQKNSVLLVPARVIAQQGGSSYVQVIKADGTNEQRLIQTGLTDGQNTEVTSGLTEGEKVMAAARAATPTTTTPAGPGGGIRLPGGLLR